MFIHLNFVENNNVLVDTQNGFGKHFTSSDAALRLLQQAYEAIDNNGFLGTVSLDQNKAFDIVNHNVLLYKLSSYGVRCLVLDIMRSYMKNGAQFVCIKGMFSAHLPQGSVLGPFS